MGTDDSERIPFKVFIVVTGILLGLALLLVAARMVIRFRSQRKLHLDDFVLMFACLTLIASQALLYILKIENLYWLGEIGFDAMNPQSLASILEDPEAFYRRVLKIQRMEDSSAALTWTSIFAVKICFLLFFYQLIIRLRRLLLAWKVIFGVTIFFWAYCICTTFISCPHFDRNIIKCSQGRGLTQGIAMNIISVVLDIMSDLLLISIPLILLWKVKIKRVQKIFFGIFLCLSICMMMIAIVRTSGFVIKNTFDMVWVIFWHQVEGAVAIIMVSITAFRSLLGIQALKVREKKRMERSWFLHRPRLLARYFKKDTNDESESQQLPSIPSATLTGMRTFINDNGIWDEPKAMEMTHKSEKDWLRTTTHEPQEIKVIHQVSVKLDILEGAKIARAAGFV